MLNGNLLTKKEKSNLDRLFTLWKNFEKIINNLNNEKFWLEYDECHIGQEIHKDQKKIIENTLELLEPYKSDAWFKYRDEWDRLDKKYS